MRVGEQKNHRGTERCVRGGSRVNADPVAAQREARGIGAVEGESSALDHQTGRRARAVDHDRAGQIGPRTEDHLRVRRGRRGGRTLPARRGVEHRGRAIPRVIRPGRVPVERVHRGAGPREAVGLHIGPGSPGAGVVEGVARVADPQAVSSGRGQGEGQMLDRIVETDRLGHLALKAEIAAQRPERHVEIGLGAFEEIQGAAHRHRHAGPHPRERRGEGRTAEQDITDRVIVVDPDERRAEIPSGSEHGTLGPGGLAAHPSLSIDLHLESPVEVHPPRADRPVERLRRGDHAIGHGLAVGPPVGFVRPGEEQRFYHHAFGGLRVVCELRQGLRGTVKERRPARHDGRGVARAGDIRRVGTRVGAEIRRSRQVRVVAAGLSAVKCGGQRLPRGGKIHRGADIAHRDKVAGNEIAEVLRTTTAEVSHRVEGVRAAQRADRQDIVARTGRADRVGRGTVIAGADHVERSRVGKTVGVRQPGERARPTRVLAAETGVDHVGRAEGVIVDRDQGGEKVHAETEGVSRTGPIRGNGRAAQIRPGGNAFLLDRRTVRRLASTDEHRGPRGMTVVKRGHRPAAERGVRVVKGGDVLQGLVPVPDMPGLQIDGNRVLPGDGCRVGVVAIRAKEGIEVKGAPAH